ncbi:MAG: c-type cytochrome [Pseudomonadota bacterium]
MKNVSTLMKAGVAGVLVTAAMAVGSVSAGEKSLVQLAQASGDFDPARTYTQSCAACHNSGAAGAPRFGNSDDWSARMEKGFDTLVEHTIDGFNNIMPPRGMCFDCTDEQLAEVVQYILDESIQD